MDNSRLITYRVSGNSMSPILHDGQEIQVKREENYRVGDIVVAVHPIQTDLIIVKLIESIESGLFRLRGINSKESTDNFGLIPGTSIIGRVSLD